MIRTVLLHWLMFSLFLLLVVPSAAGAVELKVFCTHALTPAMEKLAPEFERKTGTKLVIFDSTTGAAMKRISSGEVADVVILTGSAIRKLAQEGKLDPKTVKDIAATGISVAVRAGAPKPDISSASALKQAVLSAKSIAYTDPAAGGASGIHFAKVLQRLGIADQVKPKTTLVGGGGAVGPLVASGKAEMGVQMESELRATKGIEIVGPLPGDLQDLTLFSGGIFAGSKNAAAGKRLIKFLRSAKAAPVLKATGMQIPK